MRHLKFIPAILALLASMTLLTSSGRSQNQTADPSASTAAQTQTKAKAKTVYVCACLKTKSCSCMTEARTKGPCSCGTEGGPPMKGVPSDSAWAKENRDALAR